jgi:hypothetical protein
MPETQQAQVTIDYDKLADILLHKLETRFLKMPAEFKRRVMKGYAFPIVNIALDSRTKDEADPVNEYWSLEAYAHHDGGLRLTIRDVWGRTIWERNFS